MSIDRDIRLDDEIRYSRSGKKVLLLDVNCRERGLLPLLCVLASLSQFANEAERNDLPSSGAAYFGRLVELANGMKLCFCFTGYTTMMVYIASWPG